MDPIPRDPVPPKFFGRDHWSTFGYLECRVVDHQGHINNPHMRCNPARHPGLAHIAWSRDCPTRLAGDVELPQHDDWDCLYDLEAAGLIKNKGTGIYPVVVLTPLGRQVAGKLREHKAKGQSFATFRCEELVVNALTNTPVQE